MLRLAALHPLGIVPEGIKREDGLPGAAKNTGGGALAKTFGKYEQTYTTRNLHVRRAGLRFLLLDHAPAFGLELLFGECGRLACDAQFAVGLRRQRLALGREAAEARGALLRP